MRISIDDILKNTTGKIQSILRDIERPCFEGIDYVLENNGEAYCKRSLTECRHAILLDQICVFRGEPNIYTSVKCYKYTNKPSI